MSRQELSKWLGILIYGAQGLLATAVFAFVASFVFGLIHPVLGIIAAIAVIIGIAAWVFRP